MSADFLMNEEIETTMNTVIQVNELYRGFGFNNTAIFMDEIF